MAHRAVSRPPKNMRIRLSANIAAVFAMAFWWGGLTFYSLVAVPIGMDVLGGAAEQGFITRLVAKWINISGGATLAVLLASAASNWRFSGKFARTVLASTWLAMAILQALLFAIHPQLDAMLNVSSHDIADPDRFHQLHEIYLTVVGVIWFAGLVHLLTVLLNWPIGKPTSDDG
jgi:hypothetical protein